MGAGELGGLPRSVAAEIEAKRGQRAVGGIGAGARENRGGAGGMPVDQATPAEQAEQQTAADEGQEADWPNCPLCKKSMILGKDWKFCAHCGADILAINDPAKKLGISFDVSDVQDYIFKGYVVRDLKILGSHVITVRSSQAKDIRVIDDLVMNGEYIPKDTKISDYYLSTLNRQMHTAVALQKLDGTSIITKPCKTLKDELVEKLGYLEERGAAFNDIVSAKVVLYNQALTKYLQEADAVLGS